MQYTIAEFVRGFEVPKSGVVGLVPECGHGSVIVAPTTAGGLVHGGGIEFPLVPFLEFNLERTLRAVEHWVWNAGLLSGKRVVICAKCPVCAPRTEAAPEEV